MINQQILDYIKQQIQQGVSREQIKSSLIANGWQAQDIEEGFNNIDALNTPTAYSVAPVAASSGLWKIIAGVVIGVAVLGGSAYLASQTIFKSEEAPKIANKVANQTPTETPSESLIPQQPSEQPTPQTQPQNPEIVFADKLSSCAKYKATLKHPLTGDMLEKEILGVVGDKCNYIEQMPNGGKMECKYSESESMVVAQYYKDVANAESVGTSFSADLGREEQKATYTINGKVVDNPLQEVMTSGACVISGY
jgi:hypothetical protein